MEAAVDRSTMLKKAQALGELAASHVREAEENRRVSGAVIDEMVRSGLLRLLRPKSFDGYELDPVTYVEVIREIARGEVATGWLYGVLSIHEWFMAYVRPELQAEVWGQDRDALIVDSLAPVGKAERASDGYMVTGRWKFVSGVEWCSWVAVNTLVVLPDGEGPEPCMFFLPRSDFRIEDEWNVVGLRGTASNTIVVDSVFVPEHRMLPMARVAATGKPLGNPGESPIYKVPFVPMLAACIYPTPLGGAQKALEEFRKWTEGRVRPFALGAKEKEAPSAQLTLAESGTRWDGAHALAIRYAEEVYRLGKEGRSAISEEERARFFAWRAFIGRTSAEITGHLFLNSGGNSIFEDHPLQQLWRDTHAAAQHVSLVYGDAMTSLGRTQMGFPGHPLL